MLIYNMKSFFIRLAIETLSRRQIMRFDIIIIINNSMLCLVIVFWVDNISTSKLSSHFEFPGINIDSNDP